MAIPKKQMHYGMNATDQCNVSLTQGWFQYVDSVYCVFPLINFNGTYNNMTPSPLKKAHSNLETLKYNHTLMFILMHQK